MVTICRVKNRLKVTFPYSPELVRKIKTVPGHYWHPKEKCWTISDTEEAIQKFFRAFRNEKINVDISLLSVARIYWPILPAPGEEEIFQKVAEEIKLRGYSPKTSKAYLNHIKRFVRDYRRKQVTELTNKEVREYLLKLIDDDKCSSLITVKLLVPLSFYINMF